MICVGWIIKSKAGLVHLNVKVYKSKAVAERYANGGKVVRAYIMEHDEE